MSPVGEVLAASSITRPKRQPSNGEFCCADQSRLQTKPILPRRERNETPAAPAIEGQISSSDRTTSTAEHCRPMSSVMTRPPDRNAVERMSSPILTRAAVRATDVVHLPVACPGNRRET
jgi:hypothetical protein